MELEGTALYATCISGILFVACLLLPTVCTATGCGDWPGWGMLAFGGIGWLGGAEFLANWAWLANPLLFAAWLALWHGKGLAAGLCSGAAGLLAVLPIPFRQWFHSEGGGSDVITGLAAGYWVWLAAIVAALVAAVLLRFDPLERL